MQVEAKWRWRWRLFWTSSLSGGSRSSTQRAVEQVVREPVLDPAEVAVVSVVVGQEPTQSFVSVNLQAQRTHCQRCDGKVGSRHRR